MIERTRWYTTADWDGEARELFETRIARSRRPWSRWQYFTIKAGALHRSGGPAEREAAVRLLRRSLTEVRSPEPDWTSATPRDAGGVGAGRR
jgi:hypothetical protein